MIAALVGLFLALAVADWIAVGRRHRTVEYVLKPASLAALIGVALAITRGPHDGYQTAFFLVGLGLSLVGDIALMLPQDAFAPGLVSFLLAHVAYIAGLNQTLPPGGAAAASLASVAVVSAVVLTRLSKGIRQREPALLAPVTVYVAVISLMLASALATLGRPDWDTVRRVSVIAGAALFYVSDGIIAWDRFLRPFGVARVIIMVTYHLGQLGLALSLITAR